MALLFFIFSVIMDSFKNWFQILAIFCTYVHYKTFSGFALSVLDKGFDAFLIWDCGTSFVDLAVNEGNKNW